MSTKKTSIGPVVLERAPDNFRKIHFEISTFAHNENSF